ncbi:MAG: hypothetical protein M3Q73_00865 [bacterium]|nr:hypothetical protein [bacterium]
MFIPLRQALAHERSAFCGQDPANTPHAGQASSPHSPNRAKDGTHPSSPKAAATHTSTGMAATCRDVDRSCSTTSPRG